eukprot:TRINITY_DN4061_c0_g1_i1.p1 TRINITY_DN4061_c0_g1~~TRINITY_DN4061_c0_g1_i1.p1  ORF type:complete len:344 (-),score=59.29 TRINITY_DN4061_c0_g1_i1:775-1806(-)
MVVVVGVVMVVVVLGLILMPAWWIQPTYPCTQDPEAEQNEQELLAAGGALDQFTLVGTHNSCHRANLLGGLAIPHWRYSHWSLRSQLDTGIRHLELDLWFNHSSRGWEVWHEAVDPLTTSPLRLVDTLRDLCGWSVGRPCHFPLWINLDLKGSYHARTSILTPWMVGRGMQGDEAEDALEALEEQLGVGWEGGRIYSPAHQQTHDNCSTARSSLCHQGGWPCVKQLQGHALFMINLYGELSGVALKAKERLCYVRKSATVPDVIYCEEGDAMQRSHTVVRRSLLASGARRDKDSVQEARADLKELSRCGVHLVASNHPHLLARHMVQRNGRHPKYCEDRNHDD